MRSCSANSARSDKRFCWGGDKGGADQRRFYKRLIAVADKRFDEHLAELAATNAKERKHGKKT